MSELTSSTALDIALGLAVLFFLLSTVCAAINELVAGWLGWRAQGLEKALRNMLGDAGDVQPAAAAKAGAPAPDAGARS